MSEAGIQRLLEAEKEAQEIIGKARKEKNDRVRRANEEAQADIKRLRDDYEAQFQKKNSMVTSLDHSSLGRSSPQPQGQKGYETGLLHDC